MVRYLVLYAKDGCDSDNHRFLRELFQGDGEQVIRALAGFAPGRKELFDLLPTLKLTAAAYYLAASKAARNRGRLPRPSADDLNLYLYGLDHDVLGRLAKRLEKLSSELGMVNASALASPVLNALDEQEARDFERLPALINRYSEALANFFYQQSSLRLPPHFDVATAQESALLDEVDLATGGPQYLDVATVLERVFTISVPRELRQCLTRAFDEKALGDRHRRFRSSRGGPAHLARLTPLLDELAEDLYAGRIPCPACGGETLRFAMRHPSVIAERPEVKRTFRCQHPSCRVWVNTVDMLVGPYPLPSRVNPKA